MKISSFFVGLVIPLLAAAETPKLHTDTTPAGVPYGWVGERPSKPAATVVFIGGAISENLTQAHYLEGVRGLGPDTWCVTIDIPGHGTETADGEPGGIATWRHRMEKNISFLPEFTRKISAVIDHWVAKGYADPARIGLFGTSRGGYMSFQIAAAEPRIRAIAGFAPVTDLLALREFNGMPGDHRARILNANRLADALHDRAIWLCIGTTDYRVSAQACIDFTERLIESATAHGRKPGVELHLGPSDGHRVPGPHPYVLAAEWMLEQLNGKARK